MDFLITENIESATHFAEKMKNLYPSVSQDGFKVYLSEEDFVRYTERYQKYSLCLFVNKTEMWVEGKDFYICLKGDFTVGLSEAFVKGKTKPIPQVYINGHAFESKAGNTKWIGLYEGSQEIEAGWVRTNYRDLLTFRIPLNDKGEYDPSSKSGYLMSYKNDGIDYVLVGNRVKKYVEKYIVMALILSILCHGIYHLRPFRNQDPIEVSNVLQKERRWKSWISTTRQSMLVKHSSMANRTLVNYVTGYIKCSQD